MKEKLAYEGKLVIATPFYGLQALSTYTESLVQTARLLERLGVDFEYWPLHGDSYVDRARNTLCTRFMKSGATDLFFIDSDESWDVIGFVRVLMAPAEVCAGSYRMKNKWEDYTADLILENATPRGRIVGPECAILLANFAPAGFLRIKSSALKKYQDAYPDLRYTDMASDGTAAEYTAFFETKIEGGMYKGEDYVFCKRWQAIGGDIWIEPNVTITHYGMNGYEGNLDKHLRGRKVNA